MAGAAIKWSDWSTLDHVSIRATAGEIAAGTELLDLKAFFRDGLTVSGYLGYRFTQDWSGWTRLTWDRGVSSGWTEHTTSLSLFAGAKYGLTESLDLSAAIGVIWLTGGTVGNGLAGAPFTASFNDSIAFVPQLGITARF